LTTHTARRTQPPKLVEHEEAALAQAGRGRYLLVFAVLVMLTALTCGLSYLPTGKAGAPLALAIAVTKATLVVLFFMHLWEQRGPARVYLLTALAFVTLLLAGVLADASTRFAPALPRGDALVPSPGHRLPTELSP
jgi:cytochrome c oxidase subunit 4